MIFDSNYLILFSFLLLLGGTAFFIYHTLKKETEFQEREKDTFLHYEKLLKKAHEEARALLDTTAETSEHILQDTHLTNEHVEEHLDTILQRMAEKHIHGLNKQTESFQKDYDERLNKINEVFDTNTQQMIEITQKGLHDALDTFTKSLVGKTAASEELIDKRTQELLAQIETEATDYKKVRLEKLDQQINQLIQKTYRDVLHRTIPETLQKDIILEALEKAKEEGVFTL
jgi:hypothetical protein